jgi:hypothetical protein
MSKYTMYYTTKQKQYLEFATNWANTTASMNLTERQRRGMALFFKPIARRFGLVKEFRGIGVL